MLDSVDRVSPQATREMPRRLNTLISGKSFDSVSIVAPNRAVEAVNAE